MNFFFRREMRENEERGELPSPGDMSCNLTYCSDLKEERASHRTFHGRYLRVHRPEPEPRLAACGPGRHPG